jgi:hypothetical protein
VTFFCYVFARGRETPYLEVLDGRTVDEAGRCADRVMRQHAGAEAAEIWNDDMLVMRLGRRGGAAGLEAASAVT